MRNPHRQRGMGWFGLLYVVGTLAAILIIGIKCFPIYMNEMKIVHTVDAIANDPELARSEATAIRSSLQKRWMIEGIEVLTPRDVRIQRDDRGRSMSYDYEARADLFYNFAIVIHFQKKVALSGVDG